MLRIVHVEEIEGLVLQLPGLVQQQASRSGQFASSVGTWLRMLEEALVANRLYQAGYIATLRSELVAVAQGHVPPGLQLRGHPTRSRILSAAASQALQRASKAASDLIAEHRPRIAEAERIAQQIIAAGIGRDLIPGRGRGATNTEYLQMLLDSLRTSADLAAALLHLDGMIGRHDALVVLDRALASQEAAVV